MNRRQIINRAAIEINANDGYRLGQAIFNIVHKLYPDIADEARATPIDPFYDDSLIHDFLDFVFNRLEPLNGQGES